VHPGLHDVQGRRHQPLPDFGKHREDHRQPGNCHRWRDPRGRGDVPGL
jgi:hypothetical protein